MNFKSNTNEQHVRGVALCVAAAMYLFCTAACSLAEQGIKLKNVAPLAKVHGEGRKQQADVDGIKLQGGTDEWSGGSPNAWYSWSKYPNI